MRRIYIDRLKTPHSRHKFEYYKLRSSIIMKALKSIFKILRLILLNITIELK